MAWREPGLVVAERHSSLSKTPVLGRARGVSPRFESSSEGRQRGRFTGEKRHRDREDCTRKHRKMLIEGKEMRRAKGLMAKGNTLEEEVRAEERR